MLGEAIRRVGCANNEMFRSIIVVGRRVLACMRSIFSVTFGHNDDPLELTSSCLMFRNHRAAVGING